MIYPGDDYGGGGYNPQDDPYSGDPNFYKAPDDKPQWLWDQIYGPGAPPTSGGGGHYGDDLTMENIIRGPLEAAPGTGGGTGGGGGDYGGGYYSGGGSSGFQFPAYRWPSYNAPSAIDPGFFDPGPAFSYKDFTAPTAGDVLKDPSFQFRMDQGRKALEASAAGKGILRSGGSMKDLLGYGQQFASQEYGNVYNRAMQEYDLNRRNAYDTWNSGYMGRKDAYGFGADRANNLNTFNLSNAQFDYNAAQRQAEFERQELLNRWLAEGNWSRDLATSPVD